MGMSLGFYVMDQNRLVDSISFTNRVSPLLVEKLMDEGVSILKELFDEAKCNREYIQLMDSHRFDIEELEKLLKDHEQNFEPYDDEWLVQKKQIEQNFKNQKKYPRVIEMVSSITAVNRVLYTKECELIKDYPLELLREDFSNLVKLINNKDYANFRLCWRVM